MKTCNFGYALLPKSDHAAPACCCGLIHGNVTNTGLNTTVYRLISALHHIFFSTNADHVLNMPTVKDVIKDR